MVKGHVPPTEEDWLQEQQEIRWCQDVLYELVASNTLWGFAIRAHSELQHMDRSELDNPVLFRTLQIGVYDGEHKSTTSAMRVAAISALRLLAQIRRLEEKVLTFPPTL